MLMGKQHRNATSCTSSSNDHFGIGDVVNERKRLQRRQRIAGLRAALSS